MYRSRSTYAVLGKPGRVLSGTEEHSDPCVSKIGGTPAWHDESAAPTEDLLCQVCGESDRMLMICQVYAPLEDLHRSLYVFCCNRRRCSLASQGWIVLRNQAATKVAPVTPPAAAEVQAPISAWAFLQDEQIQTDALQQMLQLRDESLASAAGAKSSSTTKANTAPVPAPTKSCMSQEWRPCRRIVEVDDSWAGKSLSLGKDIEKAAAKGPEDEENRDDDDEEEEEDYEDSFLDASVASDARVQEMLAGYLKDEADEELAAVLSGAGKKKGAAASSSTSSSSAAAGGGGTGRKEEAEEDEEQEQGWMRKLSRNSPRAKVERHFQQRVACEPQQVLRYAYGGEPLWCTYPPPPDGPAVVEACRHCGAKRCFEMQLMPALLALREQSVGGRETPRQAVAAAKNIAEQDGEAEDAAVQENSGSGSSSSSSSGGAGDEDDDAAFVSEAYAKPTESQFADLLQRLGDGMDFGVLAIYSCPESCQGGNVECVVVQPPCDIAV